MSYSRWSNSRWYTYPTYNTDIRETVFVICEFEENIEFNYREIKKNINKCLDIVRKKIDCTNEELDELKKYMIRYMLDMEDEKKEKYRKNASL